MKKAFANIISISSLIIVLIFCVYSIHDMQTAEGIGYFFTLKFQLGNRFIFDIIADLVIIVLFGLLLVIPFRLIKEKTFIRFNEFLLLFVALIPTIRTSYIFDLVSSTHCYRLSVDFKLWATLFVSNFRLLIPMLVLLHGINLVLKNIKPAKSVYISLVISLILLLVIIPFAGLYELATFIADYILIVLIFSSMKNIENKIWPVYILMFFTALYRLITVCQTFSIG